MREESVDGTLSPVSMKGTMDYLDNDLGTAKRKVKLYWIKIISPSFFSKFIKLVFISVNIFQTCQVSSHK